MNPQNFQKALENTQGKGKNTDNQHFVLFRQFQPNSVHINFSFLTVYLSSANAFVLDQSKIFYRSKELIQFFA